MNGEKRIPIEAVAARRHQVAGTLREQRKLLAKDYGHITQFTAYVNTSRMDPGRRADLTKLKRQVKEKEEQIGLTAAKKALGEVDAILIERATDLRDSLRERETEIVAFSELQQEGELTREQARAMQLHLWRRWHRDNALRHEIPGLQGGFKFT